MIPSTNENTESFGVAVRGLVETDSDLLTRTGNVNWTAAAEKIGMGYDTLRKAVSGERAPSVEVMEAVAKGLGVSPSYFVEYRLWQTQREFDVREVGWDKAIGNLREFTESQQQKR